MKGRRVSRDLVEQLSKAARGEAMPETVDVIVSGNSEFVARIARKHGATLVSVNHRQIAATRNSGARAAHGQRLFFVDADTQVNERAVAVERAQSSL